jgi:hypothetical protein
VTVLSEGIKRLGVRVLLPQERQQPVQSHAFTWLLKGPTQYLTAPLRHHNGEHAGGQWLGRALLKRTGISSPVNVNGVDIHPHPPPRSGFLP